MQQIISFFVAIFLFSTLFVSSVDVLLEKQHNRIAKQNLNLTGRDIVNHISYEEGRLRINEKEYLDNISNIIGTGEIIGGIFYYNDSICVLKKNGEQNQIKIDSSLMNDNNKRNTINYLVDYLIEKDNTKIEVNIAVENEEDYLSEILFNKLKENTVFIIGKLGKNVFLSGFVMDFA